ncbi:hypothetical protein EHS25_002307 [Saitozyma podzolica]|uniref:Uncharacterized protein n=1 Tax=Saitozyma podzolica TaxID=1890683 RepID=A0A427YDG5_9TREE|nr:hypothetical protein EHS25_002307 [Saitozyma podzolica]
MTPQRERLDVESPEGRQDRLGRLLSGVVTTSPTSPAAPGVILGSGPTPGARGVLETFPVAESSALARARAFLPLMQQSNVELMARKAENPDAVDIEHTEGQDKVIMMDLGLGVFDAPGGVEGMPVRDIPEGYGDGDDDEDDEDEDDSSDEEADEEGDEDMSDETDGRGNVGGGSTGSSDSSSESERDAEEAATKPRGAAESGGPQTGGEDTAKVQRNR